MAIAIFLGQRIVKPIQQMKIKMEAISKGEANLAERLEIESEDELGQMAHAFNLFSDKLNQIILEIRETSQKISNLTSSVTQNISLITERANSQASFVHETTASVEHLSDAAKSISQDASQVLLISSTSHSSAMQGVVSVDQSHEQMQEISAKNKRATQEIINLGRKSREIERIVQLITGISVQSKIIAFNAAIEAAISGPVGQRFGVVASQIRELTVTVLESTEEIKQVVVEVQSAVDHLIEEFKSERVSVKEGVKTIEEAIEVLNGIARESEQTVRMMQQISQSTQRQTNASEQVAHSLNDILTEATQFREESITAQESISEINLLASTLLQEVDRFKVKVPEVDSK